MSDRVHYVGIDLGTFKTSAAASNGVREVIYSAVGWPKDYIARSMLGRDVVFGEETQRHRLALNVVRPLAKGALKYRSGESEESGGMARRREAARLLIHHAVSLTRPPAGAEVYGVIGAPSQAERSCKRFLLEAAQGALDAVLIAPEPFTVAYGMGRLNETLVVDIGAGTIDLCPMYGAFPSEEDQLTIPVGGDLVDEKFLELVRAAHPDARLSENMARRIKEKYGSVEEDGERAVVTLPTSGCPKTFDLTDPLSEACRLLAASVTEGIQELVSRFDPEFQRPLLDNILLSGGGAQLKGLDRLIEQALAAYGGGEAVRVGDCEFAGAAGSLKLAMNLPADQWNRIREADRETGAPAASSKAA